MPLSDTRRYARLSEAKVLRIGHVDRSHLDAQENGASRCTERRGRSMTLAPTPPQRATSPCLAGVDPLDGCAVEV